MTTKELLAQSKRRVREIQKYQRELERRAKEEAKLSALEQARLAVETYENSIRVLLSIHKEVGEQWDWTALQIALPPPKPIKFDFNVKRAKQVIAVLEPSKREDTFSLLDSALAQDNAYYLTAEENYNAAIKERDHLKQLARRIKSGDHAAYTEAIREFNPFDEIHQLGSNIHFTVHSAQAMECVISVNAKHSIPREIKSLSGSGKVSSKALPKGKFHDLYLDYLCGCVLRVGREIFALLPIEMVLITALAENIFDDGKILDAPVLSVIFPRQSFSGLNFEVLDPSDSISMFEHRGDLRASRKSDAFTPIIPFTGEDIQTRQQQSNYLLAVSQIKGLRESFQDLQALVSRQI